MLLAFIAVQVGLGAWPLRDEELRFIFLKGVGNNAKITGTLSESTRWSGPNFFDIVKRCGGERVGLQASNGRAVVVTAASGSGNVDIARCVKRSTSVRFRVGVREYGYAPAWNQEPFRELWDRT